MERKEFDGIWNYFLSIESDLEKTSRYVEPVGQENVHSFEFAKILILACTEIESVFKLICIAVEGKEVGIIAEYKEIILKNYPKIVDATVMVSRLGTDIQPYKEWSTGPLSWWSAYQEVKHSRGSHFDEATYRNAVYAIAALYIAIFYLARIENFEFHDTDSKYVSSNYEHTIVCFGPTEKLPDFEDDKNAQLHPLPNAPI